MEQHTDRSELIELSLSLPLSAVEQIVRRANADEIPAKFDRLSLAKTVLAGRRRRERLLPGIRFGEASWDMILDLYIATMEARKIDVSGLYLASGVAPTTAVRYLELLERDRLVGREADEQDRRRTFITMSEQLRQMIERWLDAELVSLNLIALPNGFDPVRG